MLINEDTIAKEYYKRVEEISFRIIGNKELAKDAVQETWVEIIKGLPNFKGKSRISTWIYTIATRTIFNYLKQDRKQVAHFGSNTFFENVYDDNSELDNEEWIVETVNKCITGSIHCLKKDEQLIYLFFDIGGLSSIEIADILSISDASVRKKMSRSRKKLHQFLNNECILFNAKGACKCKIIDKPIHGNIQEEFKKIRSDIDELSLRKQCNQILASDKSFIANLCERYNFPTINSKQH